MAKKRFPWARLWVGLAAIVSIVLAVGFGLKFYDVSLFPAGGETTESE